MAKKKAVKKSPVRKAVRAVKKKVTKKNVAKAKKVTKGKTLKKSTVKTDATKSKNIPKAKITKITTIVMPDIKYKEPSTRELVKATFTEQNILCEPTDAARDLYGQSRYGSIVEGGRVQLSLLEGLYLIEKNKIRVSSGRTDLGFDGYLKKARKIFPNFWIRYSVFRDLRGRGYIVKTALKFGADFRVYDRGVKPGEDHARWVVYPAHESDQVTWYEFSAKNRVAHSTKKRLLVGVVDDEGDVTYYEIRWMRP